MSETAGSSGRVAFDTDATFDGNSTWLEFVSENIVLSEEIVRTDGIRGTRMRDSANAAVGPRRVSGTIAFVVTRKWLDLVLPAVLGANESSNVFNVAETIPDFYLLIDKGADVELVGPCKASTLTLSWDTGVLNGTLAIEAEDMVGGQTWPAGLTQPNQSKPYVYSDLGDITIDGTARVPFGGEIVIDNLLSSDQFGNSLTREDLIIATDRDVRLAIDVSGDSSNADLLDHVGSVGVVGEAITLTFTSANESGSSITIVFGRVAFNKVQPVTQGKGPRRMRIAGSSRGHLHPGAVEHVPDVKFTNAHS